MSTNRRKFLEKFAQLGTLTTLPVLATEAAPTPVLEEKNHFIAGPYLQNLLSDEITIMWITHKNSLSWVEYGEGAYLSKKAFAYQDGLIEANNRINKITISGLTAGANHKYRIVSTEILGYSGSKVHFGETIMSGIYSFKTPAANEEEFKMVVFNDIHDRAQTIPQLLYRHGFSGNTRDFDFVVFNGDTFETTNNETQIIEHLLKPCGDVFSTERPFVFVQGNHEVRGAFSRQLPQYFASPNHKFYYAFTRGPVRFVVLDAGEDKTDDNWEYGGLSAFDRYREIQKKWLEQEIETPEFKKAPFRIVLIHISPFHSGDWHGPMHCQKVFGPVLNKAKIDLQISGHTHRYATHEPDNTHNYPIVIGGGPVEGNRTLIKLHATSKELNLQMIRDDGEVVGKFNLKRKA